jgi:hypothetical protein
VTPDPLHTQRFNSKHTHQFAPQRLFSLLLISSAQHPCDLFLFLFATFISLLLFLLILIFPHLPPVLLRSSETVKLIDLLDSARDRMRDSLQARAEEGKCPLKVRTSTSYLHSMVQEVKYKFYQYTILLLSSSFLLCLTYHINNI